MESRLVDIPEAQEGLFVTRRFEAPRDWLFHMLTDPISLQKWWGRPMDFQFLEVREPEILVFKLTKQDEEQKTELEVQYIITLCPEKEWTRLILKARVLRCIPEIAWALDMMIFALGRGWEEGLNRLQVEALLMQVYSCR
jgi:uncharacterized protein YndB with AHSA1/START domain